MAKVYITFMIFAIPNLPFVDTFCSTIATIVTGTLLIVISGPIPQTQMPSTVGFT
jgi:hypothetical protein